MLSQSLCCQPPHPVSVICLTPMSTYRAFLHAIACFCPGATPPSDLNDTSSGGWLPTSRNEGTQKDLKEAANIPDAKKSGFEV